MSMSVSVSPPAMDVGLYVTISISTGVHIHVKFGMIWVDCIRDEVDVVSFIIELVV